jgi:broad specificity phosphatase PhoE
VIGSRAGAERTVVAVRHGETDWNVEQRFQGQLDIPLNAAGCRQAEALRLRLSALRFDSAYSSPLRRALDTARVIAADFPILADERLTEIHHGCWQGKTIPEIESLWPDQWEQWRKGSQSFAPPGGESSMRVRARIEDFLRSIRGTSVLCVSHGVVIQMLVKIITRDSRAQGSVPANASIHIFRFRNGYPADYRVEGLA